MITPYIIGQILGISFLIIGLAIIFNTKNTSLVIERLTKDNPSLWLSGFFALLFGSFLLASSNFSNGKLTSTLAVLGILSFLKGVLMLWFPGLISRFYRRVGDKRMVLLSSGIISIAISIFLIINSF